MRASYLTILCSRPAGDPCLDAVLGLVCSDNWALTSLGGRPGGPASLMHRLPASVGTLTLKKKKISRLYICLLLFQFDVLSPVGQISGNFQNWQWLTAHCTFLHVPFRFPFCEMFLKLSIRFKNWSVTKSFATQNDRKCKNSKHSVSVQISGCKLQAPFTTEPAHLPLEVRSCWQRLMCFILAFTGVWCLLYILFFHPFLSYSFSCSFLDTVSFKKSLIRYFIIHEIFQISLRHKAKI